jgi:hypothetical protein
VAIVGRSSEARMGARRPRALMCPLWRASRMPWVRQGRQGPLFPRKAAVSQRPGSVRAVPGADLNCGAAKRSADLLDHHARGPGLRPCGPSSGRRLQPIAGSSRSAAAAAWDFSQGASQGSHGPGGAFRLDHHLLHERELFRAAYPLVRYGENLSSAPVSLARGMACHLRRHRISARSSARFLVLRRDPWKT